jgi:glycine hydroxymethyltransferase
MNLKHVKKVDSEVAELTAKERKRQEDTLMMIPSENYASQAVEEVVGSALGNKYAEGYPYRRYYEGQKYVDQLETICRERALEVFGLDAEEWGVNVQAYSGSPANSAIYFGLLEPGDKIMGLALAHGGHLTHGHPKITFSGRFFDSVQYEVAEDGRLDYDELMEFAKKEQPAIIVAGTTAYPRTLDFEKFREIADEVDAYLMADISHISGLVAAGSHPSPFPHADVVMTTTHKTLRGTRGAMIFSKQELKKQIDKAVFPGLQGGPHMNAIGGIAVALHEAMQPSFEAYGKQVVKNAKALAERMKEHGFKLISDGTDNHLLLVDLRNKGVSGRLAAIALEEAGIVLNRNSIPYDPNPPFYPSGIRMGTPGMTSRGMKEEQMEQVGDWINEVVEETAEIKEELGIKDFVERKKSDRDKVIEKLERAKEIEQEVKKLCKEFPIPDTY